MRELQIPKRISIIGWTPVEEALPDKSGHYLTYANEPYLHYFILYWADSHKEWWALNEPQDVENHITHWAEVTPPEATDE